MARGVRWLLAGGVLGVLAALLAARLRRDDARAASLAEHDRRLADLEREVDRLSET